MGIHTPETKRLKAKKEFKTLNSNTTEKTPVKVCEFYRDTFTWRQMPVSQTYLDALAKEWVDFVRNDKTAIRLTDFMQFKGIPRNTFDSWILKYPSLKEAKAIVQDYISTHREKGVCIKDDKGNTKLAPQALHMMFHYDSDWKAVDTEKAKLSVKENTDSNIRVEMVAYPSSNLVPEKKKDSDE